MKRITIENFLKMNPQIPQYSDKNQSYLIAGANPIYYLENGIQEEQVAPLAASIDWSQISTTVLDSYSETNQDSLVAVYGGSANQFQGQSFANTNATTLSGAKFYLKKVGSPTGSVTAQLYAHTGTYGSTGTPTGAVLDTSTALDISTLTTSYELKTFIFSGGVTLAANTKYVIVITYGGGDGSNALIVGVDNSSAAHAGNPSFSTNGSSWTANTSYDVCFYVYGGGIGVGAFDGNIVHMIPSTNTTYAIYAIDTTTKLYGVSLTTGIADLGYINGGTTPTANVGSYLAIGGGTTTTGNIFATNANSGSVFRMPLPSGTWGTAVGSVTSSNGVHLMEPFLDFIAIRDGVVAGSPGGLVKKLDVTTTGTISAGIDLGAGFGIMQMRNLNNKYLAIAGGKTASASLVGGYAQNFIFLWNGIGSTYQYAVRVPGKFIDMRVVDSVLYVEVQVSDGKTYVYHLSGTTLKKTFTPQVATINSDFTNMAGLVLCSLFDFKNYLGIHLNDIGTLTDPIMVYGKDEVGEFEFIHSSGRNFDQFSIGYDGYIYVNKYVSGGASVLYYLPTTGTTYQNILWNSQWIPVKNAYAIDVYYEGPPQSGTDQINVVVYGQGEDITSGSSTTTTANIGPANFLTMKRTRLDLDGFAGDMMKIQLTTTNSTWRPIIRAVSIIQS